MAEPAFKDGDGGGGGFDPRDVTIYCLEQENAEFRAVLRRLLDSEGEEAGAAIEAAENLLEAHDTVDAEIEGDKAYAAHIASPVCDDCGTWKGTGTSYCPDCDAEGQLYTLETNESGVCQMREVTDFTKEVVITPEMIAAGVAAVDPYDDEVLTPSEKVELILLAGLKHRLVIGVEGVVDRHG